jgi:F-type H+-transporting ATPase subunit b
MSGLAVLLAAAEEEHSTFEAHSPILPETLEIIWGGLAFIIVAVFLYKLAWPAIKKMMAARTERIQRELDNAARAKSEADAAAADIRAKLGDIDGERARILSDADTTADRVLVEGRARLDQEVVDLQARASAEMASAGGRVASELQAEVGTMAGVAAERLVADQLDDATAQRLVEDFIAKVGEGRSGDV